MKLVAKQFFVYYVEGERREVQAGGPVDVPDDLGVRLLSQAVVEVVRLKPEKARRK